MSKDATAIVVGVGAERGLGAALARRFARERHVFVVGRTQERIDLTTAAIRQAGGSAESFRADAASEADVAALFDRAMSGAAAPPADVVLFNAGASQPNELRNSTVAFFEEQWRANCLGGFVVGRETARRFTPLGRGTLIFTGARFSSSGLANFSASSASKFALRGLAQSMAREFGSQGLHVAHVIADGGIDGERLNTRYPGRREQLGPNGLLDIDAIAETYWHIHRQPPSAWTHEMDLRPMKHAF